MPSRFPDPAEVPSDVVAIGDDLSVETLIDAYTHGIFPWPHRGYRLPWFSPQLRTVLFFDDFHVGRSLRKRRSHGEFRFSIDQAFAAVIQACSEVPRPGRPGTWISAAMRKAYQRLHFAGMVHSVEVWQEDRLVGGLYGVDAGGVFTGESMFHLVSDASKLAFWYLVEHLASRGAHWLDCQVMTPHMESFGAREIPRKEFLEMLKIAQSSGIRLF